MAWKQKEEYDSEGTTSKFNAGLFQMQRIHKLQEQINEAKVNPLSANERWGIYNYELWVNSLVGLHYEVESKLTDTEKELVVKFIYAIQESIEKNPPFKTLIIRDTSRRKFDEKIWNLLRNNIYKLESLIKQYVDKHGYASPEKDYEEDML